MKKTDAEIIMELRNENQAMRSILQRLVRGSWGQWSAFLDEIKKFLKEG